MIGAKINLNGALLPEGWTVQLVGEVGEYINGFAFKPSDWHDSGVPIVRIQNLTDTKKPYNYYPGKIDEKYRVRSGDILISWSASLGTYLWRGDDAWLNQHIFKAIPDETKIERDFFYWAMVYAIDRIAKNARGSTMVHVTGNEFKESEFLLPPRSEQRKIAAVLGLVQRAIERQKRLLALTVELKNALLQQLFTRGLRNESEEDSEIGPIPQSWQLSRLDEFCILQRGFDITKKEQTLGVVPVVSSGGIASHHNVAKVKGPGVVIGRKGTLGKVHFVEVDYWPHDTTLWVRDFKGNDPQFTAYFLETLRFERYDSGASNPTLNRNTIHSELVAYPNLEDQREIGRILRSFDEKAELHRRKQATLSALLRTLLHELMTAQIRVKDLDLEMVQSED